MESVCTTLRGPGGRDNAEDEMTGSERVGEDWAPVGTDAHVDREEGGFGMKVIG